MNLNRVAKLGLSLLRINFTYQTRQGRKSTPLSRLAPTPAHRTSVNKTVDGYSTGHIKAISKQL